MVEDVPIISSIAEALKAVDDCVKEGGDFVLPISDALQDPVGINMAIIMDRILSHEMWMPDGFEQRAGFRLYRYRLSQ